MTATTTIILADGTQATGTLVKQPTEPRTPALDRKYEALETLPKVHKGKQRQTIVDLLLQAKAPITPKEMAKLARAKGYKVVDDRVEDSCSYHLHILAREGFVKVS